MLIKSCKFFQSKKIKNDDAALSKSNTSSNDQNRENDFKLKIPKNKSPVIDSSETNRLPVSVVKPQPEKKISSPFLKEREKETLKEIKRKKLLEEVELLSSKVILQLNIRLSTILSHTILLSKVVYVLNEKAGN